MTSASSRNKKPSRLPARLAVICSALVNSLKPRCKPETPKRILIAHYLLLGDTLMLTPLLAKLRQQYPLAEIIMATPTATQPLYEQQPYGVKAVAFDPRDIKTIKALKQQPGFDLAIIPGDNRYSWLARALDSRWIIAFAGDRPAYKSWPVDELIPYSNSPKQWGEMVAEMITGPAPTHYQPEQWPAPHHQPYSAPNTPYCVLHAGASSPLKFWPTERWQSLAQTLTERGYQVVLSGGSGEQKLIDAIDPNRLYHSYAEKLSLPQLWNLFAKAKLIACPDTGVAHLGRLVGTPTVVLFGPGNPNIHGGGDFWRNTPYTAISNAIDCRDQHLLYKRELPWVQRCGRSPAECPEARCMLSISVEQVKQAISDLIT